MIECFTLKSPARNRYKSITINSITPPDLGTVASAIAGDTVFTFPASSGIISVKSGSGQRLTTGSARATVTITCSGTGQTCSTAAATVTLTNTGTPTLRARSLTNFTASSGTATVTNEVINGNTTTFTLGGFTKNNAQTFYVGADLGIAGNDSGLATSATSADSQFLVSISGQGSLSASALAKIYRGLSMTASPAGGLNFGSIVKPSAGTTTVDVNAATGARTLTGGTAPFGLASPTPTRVVYTATGEGAQLFSLSVPATVSMTSGVNTLTVTLTSTAANGPQTLSSAIGSNGTFSFGVGGSFPLLSTTPTGVYTGSYTVTVSYN